MLESSLGFRVQGLGLLVPKARTKGLLGKQKTLSLSSPPKGKRDNFPSLPLSLTESQIAVLAMLCNTYGMCVLDTKYI
jgi:hypothetical protein